MTRESAAHLPVIYHIDGRNIKSASDFYREIGSAVNGTGGYFGRNLDALADCLRGGFGTPEHRPFEFEWQHSALSRRYLDEVHLGQRSLFDAIREVFRDAGVPLKLSDTDSRKR
jgi:RNAse (barnase) inhibitor barstar